MTPNTATPFHLAYILAAVIYGGYAVSLWFRARRVRERRHAIERGQRA